ncbi:MAG: hypothetical protein IPJ65_02635 [Archangiaceae bacterium]|nr:hypothetical protein [Archangiaceae bacterium]
MLSRTLPRFPSWVVAALTMLFARSAMACPACGQTGGQNQEAYMWMTVMMCLVPLGAIAGVVLWVRSEARKADATE